MSKTQQGVVLMEHSMNAAWEVVLALTSKRTLGRPFSVRRTLQTRPRRPLKGRPGVGVCKVVQRSLLEVLQQGQRIPPSVLRSRSQNGSASGGMGLEGTAHK